MFNITLPKQDIKTTV